jgi:hypothetical protein
MRPGLHPAVLFFVSNDLPPKGNRHVSNDLGGTPPDMRIYIGRLAANRRHWKNIPDTQVIFLDHFPSPAASGAKVVREGVRINRP